MEKQEETKNQTDRRAISLSVPSDSSAGTRVSSSIGVYGYQHVNVNVNPR